MTDIIYERGAVREAAIWNAFVWNGPFGEIHSEERGILFGLYANTYLHGHSYLQAIETEDLARLVDTYTINMAQLTNDEAKTVLNIAAKRYIESITNQIHAADIVTRQRKLAALDNEYDAKIAALGADYAALETMRLKVQLAWDTAEQKIKELEMRTELEDINSQMVEVDITEKQLQAARADLAVIEAGLKGLDIQLAIAQVGIDSMNTQITVTEVETREAQIDVDISEIDLAESQVAIDVTETGVRTSQTELDGQKILSDVAKTATAITEAGVQVAQIEMDGQKIQSDTVGVSARITETEIDIAQAELDGRRIQANTVESRVNKIEAGVRKVQIELDGEKTQLDTVGIGVRITEAETAEAQSEMDGQKIQLDTSKVHSRITEAELDVSEAEARLTQYDAEIAKIHADTEKLGLVDTELTLANADSRITEAENDMLIIEKSIIESDIVNKDVETSYRETQQGLQETLDGDRLSNDQAEHDFKIGMSQKETLFDDEITGIKVAAFDEKKELADLIKDTKTEDAEDRTEFDDTRSEVAQLLSAATIEAAQNLATANIMNTLTHTIGT